MYDNNTQPIFSFQKFFSFRPGINNFVFSRYVRRNGYSFEQDRYSDEYDQESDEFRNRIRDDSQERYPIDDRLRGHYDRDDSYPLDDRLPVECYHDEDHSPVDHFRVADHYDAGYLIDRDRYPDDEPFAEDRQIHRDNYPEELIRQYSDDRNSHDSRDYSIDYNDGYSERDQFFQDSRDFDREYSEEETPAYEFGFVQVADYNRQRELSKRLVGVEPEFENTEDVPDDSTQHEVELESEPLSYNSRPNNASRPHSFVADR